MSTDYFSLNEDCYLQCPYDQTHFFPKDELKSHVDACRQIFFQNVAADPQPVVIRLCRFNTMHQIPDVELDFHELFCENSVPTVSEQKGEVSGPLEESSGEQDTSGEAGIGQWVGGNWVDECAGAAYAPKQEDQAQHLEQEGWGNPPPSMPSLLEYVPEQADAQVQYWGQEVWGNPPTTSSLLAYVPPENVQAQYLEQAGWVNQPTSPSTLADHEQGDLTESDWANIYAAFQQGFESKYLASSTNNENLSAADPWIHLQQ